MNLIRKKIITSQFGEKESEVFVYTPERQSNKVLFLLKGMYGRYDPITDKVSSKWDAQFVYHFTKSCYVVCCNTSSKKISPMSDFDARKQAYDGKTFQEEISDVELCIQKTEEILKTLGVDKPLFYFFGKSFGGTILLALKQILDAQGIFMVGSGCGKSETTTRTILRTMPEEAVLLRNISKYKNGNFHFIRGELDEVVPIESQEKIVNSVDESRRDYVVVKGVDHEFEKVNGKYSDFPITYLIQKVSTSLM